MWYAVDANDGRYLYEAKPKWTGNEFIGRTIGATDLKLNIRPGECVEVLLTQTGAVEQHLNPVKWTEIGSTSVAVVDGKTLTVIHDLASERRGFYIDINGSLGGYENSRELAKYKAIEKAASL